MEVGMSKISIYFRWSIIILFSVMLLVIILQNMGTCDVKILFIRIENVPIFILIAVSILIGMAIGIVFTFLSFRKLRRKEKPVVKDTIKKS
jgi:uncharacterized integral membrane protein